MRIHVVALRVLLYVVAFVAPPVLVSVLGVKNALARRYEPPPAAVQTTASDSRPAPIDHHPGKPTVVVLLNNRGSEVTDGLAPYGVFADSGAFNVYTAAPEPTAAILSGGLDLVRQLSFAQLDRLLGGKDPEVIVVPAMWDVGSAEQRPVADWLRQHAAGATTVMSVCDGGLRLIPRHDLDGAPRLDRLLVPGREAESHTDPGVRSWTDRQGLTLEFVPGDSPASFAFDATLPDLARHENAPVAHFTARLLEYPTSHLSSLAPAGRAACG